MATAKSSAKQDRRGSRRHRTARLAMWRDISARDQRPSSSTKWAKVSVDRETSNLLKSAALANEWAVEGDERETAHRVSCGGAELGNTTNLGRRT
jgi:hypothetical protein